VVTALKHVGNIQSQERATVPGLDNIITNRYRYLPFITWQAVDWSTASCWRKQEHVPRRQQAAAVCTTFQAPIHHLPPSILLPLLPTSSYSQEIKSTKNSRRNHAQKHREVSNTQLHRHAPAPASHWAAESLAICLNRFLRANSASMNVFTSYFCEKWVLSTLRGKKIHVSCKPHPPSFHIEFSIPALPSNTPLSTSSSDTLLLPCPALAERIQSKKAFHFAFAGRERAHLNSGLSGSAWANISCVDERFGKAATPPGKIEARRSLDRSSFAFLICTKHTQSNHVPVSGDGERWVRKKQHEIGSNKMRGMTTRFAAAPKHRLKSRVPNPPYSFPFPHPSLPMPRAPGASP
jgi:hypothetical protein